jgi:heat shock protein HslJ
MKICLYFIAIILSVLSCEKESADLETWWINSAKKDCVGVGPMSCLQIQKADTIDSTQWRFFYDQIEGFEYEPGYIYQVRVKVIKKSEPIPADASSMKYELVKIVSKEMDENLKLTNSWKVLKVGDIEQPTNSKTKEALIFELDASKRFYSGDLGCNTVRGSIKSLDQLKLEFGPGASTKMACMDMSVENEILKAITNTKAYQIAENQLTLLDENGAVLLLFQAVD